MGDKLSGSRFPRLVRLGWLARHGIPIAWRRLRQVAEAPDAERAQVIEEAWDEHAETAEEAFRTLGDLKGLALKAGQMLSYLDGVLPAAYQPAWQRVLARLQAEAPSLPWTTIEPVIAASLGRPVADVFAEIDEAPFAAASIGQVHRGRLRTGADVAVKVQYPGVDRALASDLANAKLMKSFLTPFLLGSGRRAMRRSMQELMDELGARFLEELDYEREARMQERFRAWLAGDPELRVPRVFLEASGRQVLTSEFVTGRTLAEVCASAPQGDRDRWGLALNRWMLSSVYEHRTFNADPHPGNYLFPADGTLVLLDFGCVKEIHDWMADAIRGYFRAAVRAERTGAAGDVAAFERALADAYHLDPKDAAFPLYAGFVRYCLRPYLRDEEFQFTSDYAAGSVELLLDGMKGLVFPAGRRLPRIPDLPSIPADYAFLSRLQWGFYSVLARLRCRGNFHRLLPESIRA